MGFFRLFIIVLTTFRFGLDEIIFSRMSRYGIGMLWRSLFFWRRYHQPRAVRLRLALESLGPIFVKFGQAISTRRDLLPADFAEELAKLQDRVPPESPAKIRAALIRAYGKNADDVFAEFDETPVGSASVAQVHRAILKDGREVAVKILRPGIGGVVRKDLLLLYSFARFAETILREGRRLKPRAVVGEFEKHLGEEMNLLREAANCAQLGRNFADSNELRIPKVHWEFCGREVMVMEFLKGVPVSRADELRKMGVDEKRLARVGVEIFFTQVFRDSFFHADMHPGNIHVDKDGRYIALDFGIVGRLSDFDKEYLARNFLAFFNRDYRRVAEMHVEAGWTPADTPVAEFEAEIRAVCEPIFAKPLREISFGKFLMQMFQTARRFNLEVQPQLVLLQKTLLNVEGMGRDLDPDLNLWDSAKPFMEKWAAKRYGLRHSLSALREQSPEWAALILEFAPAARRVLRRIDDSSRRSREVESLRRENRRLIFLCAILGVALAAAVAAFFLR